jgi:hypothetical protein
VTLFLLKLVLVPGLVGLVTLSVRRWGPAVGGWLSALPVVAGPVLVFYAIEQGTAFAAEAAHATLAGLMATSGFCVAYARSATRFRWYACVASGWGTFAIATWLLLAWRPGLIVSLAGLALATFVGRRALPHVTPSAGRAPAPAGDLPVRMLAAAVLVLALTGLASRLGPALSGLLNAFPVLTTTIAAFTHAQRGSAAAVMFAGGYLRAVPGFALFCFVLSLAVRPLGLPGALSCALVVQLLATAVILRAPGASRAAEA